MQKLKKIVLVLFSLMAAFNVSPVIAQEKDQYALLDTFIVEQYVNNETLLVAKEDFDRLIEVVTFTDLSSEELSGSTSEEVKEKFKASVEPKVESDEAGNTIHKYYYEIEEINPVTEKPMQAEMILFFHQDHLEYAGVTTPDFKISNTDGPEMKTVTKWSEHLSPMSELTEVLDASDKKPILGYAVMNYDNTFYPQIMLTAHQEGEENPMMLMAALQDENIKAIGATTVASIYVDPQTQMMSFFGQLVAQFQQGD